MAIISLISNIGQAYADSLCGKLLVNIYIGHFGATASCDAKIANKRKIAMRLHWDSFRIKKFTIRQPQIARASPTLDKK